MEITKAEYLGSFPSVEKCPNPNKPEYAFIGRSNVGKSSLINMLCRRKDIARVSKKPGKTQMINYYLINESWYLVDLPGYGYAKTSKKQRLAFEKMIRNYLQNRLTLQCAFVLIDANVPPQEIDIEFINRLGHLKVPFVLAYTKIDRLKPLQCEENIENIQNELKKYWNELPEQFITSAKNEAGKKEIISFVGATNKNFTPL